MLLLLVAANILSPIHQSKEGKFEAKNCVLTAYRLFPWKAEAREDEIFCSCGEG